MAATAVDILTHPAAALGLRTGSVSVVAHNNEWANAFASVAELITVALDDPNAGVEHIGSTSVPGLAAKPMIDIAVGLADPIDADRVVERLGTIGFEFQTDLGLYGGLFFTANAATDIVISHLHVVDIDDFQWRWYLAFRDGLRADPDLRQQYQELKLAAAQEHANNRDAYTQAKFDWVFAAVNRLAPGGPEETKN